MKLERAVTALASLAHPQRLRAFRALVREGPDGLTAGALADVMKASPPAASFHLKELDRAGLIYATRSGRFIRYAVRFEAMRLLLEYLMKDCCQGRPELCGDLFQAAKKCKGGVDVC